MNKTEWMEEQKHKCQKCNGTGLIGMTKHSAKFSFRCDCGKCKNFRIPSVETGFGRGFDLDWQYE